MDALQRSHYGRTVLTPQQLYKIFEYLVIHEQFYYRERFRMLGDITEKKTDLNFDNNFIFLEDL